MLVAEGALIGMIGSTLGVALGCALAAYVLDHFGADLGAGYFRVLSPALHIAPAALAPFWLLGTAFAVFGSALPALEAGRRAPALALRAGDEEESLKKLNIVWVGAGLIALGLMLTPAQRPSGVRLCFDCADSARHDIRDAVACGCISATPAGAAFPASDAGARTVAGHTAPRRDQHRRDRRELQSDGGNAHHGRIFSPVA